MSDFECPYCDAPFTVCHDDGHGYDENVRHEDQCESCGKKFVFWTAITYVYTPEKADCLNGGDHDMRPVVHYPPHWPDRKECSMCGHEVRGRFVPLDELGIK